MKSKVVSKTTSIETSTDNPLLELEDAKAQARALLFLLTEFVSHNDEGLTLDSTTKMGLVHLNVSVTRDMDEAYDGVHQRLHELRTRLFQLTEQQDERN